MPAFWVTKVQDGFNEIQTTLVVPTKSKQCQLCKNHISKFKVSISKHKSLHYKPTLKSNLQDVIHTDGTGCITHDTTENK